MTDGTFPRAFAGEELALLRWLLPAVKPGYADVFDRLAGLKLLGVGRWGEGDYICGAAGEPIDTAGPMSQVLARGELRFDRGSLYVTVHTETDGQIEVQFSPPLAEIESFGAERERWNYSSWNPGDPSPRLHKPVREIPLARGGASNSLLLCIAPEEETIWLFEAGSGINHPVPLTNFHNELMLHLRIRDPKIVHAPKEFFGMQRSYRDEDLRSAFLRYNSVWRKVLLQEEEPPAPAAGAAGGFRKLFSGKGP